MMNSIQDKITVIVPVYNAEKYLHRCVNSILNQTHKNLEIFLVNDGSRDSSLEICKNYATKDDRIIVLDKENGGQWSARNMALDRATGDFIGFVDNDDWLLPEMYEELLILSKKYGTNIARSVYHLTSAPDSKGNSEENIHEVRKIEIKEFEELLITDKIASEVINRLFSRELVGDRRFEFSRSIEDMNFMRAILPYANGETVTTKNLYIKNDRDDATSHVMAKSHISSYERAVEFQKRYHYSLHRCNQATSDIVLRNAVTFGVGSFRMMRQGRTQFNSEITTLLSFFKTHKKAILSNNTIPLKYKMVVTTIATFGKLV